MVAFFWKPAETSEKSRPYWHDDLFFWISTENLVKTRPTQKFWPLQKQILPPLELRSSCGSDMSVNKNCASPTRSLTARHRCCSTSIGYGLASAANLRIPNIANRSAFLRKKILSF